MAKLDDDIEGLRSKAFSLGAVFAAPISARAVVVDARVGLKCRVPLCAHYGRSFMCPPLCPSPETFAAGLARYGSGMLVQAKVVADPSSMGWLERDASLSLVAKDESYLAAMNASMNAFSVLMGKLERAAHGLGYGFSPRALRRYLRALRRVRGLPARSGLPPSLRRAPFHGGGRHRRRRDGEEHRPYDLVSFEGSALGRPTPRRIGRPILLRGARA